jgi:hypothetical protein
MYADQTETLKRLGYNDFIGHTLQMNGHCKCGALQWPHSEILTSKPCFVGGGLHNFAADGICQDCGNKSEPFQQ